MDTDLLDSRFRGNDSRLSYLVIPAQAGIHEVLPLNIELLLIYHKPCMTFRVIVYILTKKTPIILICMIGVVAVSYGMFKDNSLIFIIGLLLVFGGYLLIRRKMKESIRNNP